MELMAMRMGQKRYWAALSLSFRRISIRIIFICDMFINMIAWPGVPQVKQTRE